MEDLAAFARLIEALRPWLGHLVIVGGWAHRLYRVHPLATAPAYLPLVTRDTDVALSLRAPLEGDISEALNKAGFQADFSGEHTPPVTQYRLGEEDGGFYAEFLTPLHGDGFKRDGHRDVTVKKAGITAQKLRLLDLLLIVPWSVRVGPAVNVPLGAPADVLIANPVSFIVQKLLIHKYRNPGKKAQDVLYIHDTLELFGASLDPLRALWTGEVRPGMHAKTTNTVVSISRDLFGDVTGTIREAARMPQDRQLVPDQLRALCRYGLAEILEDAVRGEPLPPTPTRGSTYRIADRTRNDSGRGK